MGDRVAVLKDGLLGKPRELYTTPDIAFVDSFVGSPARNVVPAAVVDGGAQFGSTVVPSSAQRWRAPGPKF